MWPDRVSNLGPLAHESLPTALRGPASDFKIVFHTTNRRIA